MAGRGLARSFFQMHDMSQNRRRSCDCGLITATSSNGTTGRQLATVCSNMGERRPFPYVVWPATVAGSDVNLSPLVD